MGPAIPSAAPRPTTQIRALIAREMPGARRGRDIIVWVYDAAMRWSVVLLLVASCHDDDYLAFTGDDRKVLCSAAIDDLTQDAPWELVQSHIRFAAQHDWVVLFHAHTPDQTITRGAIDRVLALTSTAGIDFVTFRNFGTNQPTHAALALAFDDNAIDAWFSIRDQLAAHLARVTFFVSRFHSRSTEELAELAQLAADGHDIEPHSVDHLRGTDYVQAHGLDAYLSDQVLPSFTALTDAGYPAPTTYAYPWGLHDDAIAARVLE